MRRLFRRVIVPCLFAAALSAGCSRSGPVRLQGYVEGEFVHVAAPVAGRLETLHVVRGQQVEAEAPLFDLEADQERAAVRQAEETLRAAGAQLSDLGSGRRRAEIEVTEAQLEQAQASERRSAAGLARDQAQLDAGGISQEALDESRARHEVDAARVRELQGQLEVARLSARPDQIRAQTAEVGASRAALDQAAWRLAQKQVVATRAGLVFDTLFREGEWVPAGAPVVRMLPPANVKVRFFVPEPLTGRFPLGQKVSVHCDGCPADIPAAVTYASSEAEYTPPVIYSSETSHKLVFMFEARPSIEDAVRLRPGQPVDVAPR